MASASASTASNDFPHRKLPSGVSSDEAVEAIVSQNTKHGEPHIKQDVPEPVPTPDPAEGEYTYPEGGLTSWLTVLGAWCAMTAGTGLLNAIAPLQTYISQHQLRSYPESTVAWIFSLNIFLVFFAGLQVGPVFDAVGPRWLVLAGSVCYVVAMMVLGECMKYWHFILDFSLLAGLGSSLILTPSIAVIGHFFNRRRAFATGIAMTGSSLGGIIYPVIFRAVFPSLGFAWATRILGFIMLFLFVLANTFMRSRLPHRKVTRRSILPDFRIYLDGNGSMALCTAGLFLMELSLFVPLAYLTSYCVANGVDVDFSYQVIAVLNAASIFGRALPGLIADRVGRYNTMIVCLALCTLINLCLWLPVSLVSSTPSTVKAAMIAYAILFGLASGSNLGLIGPCLGQLCETKDYGRYFSTAYTIVSFSTLIGIPVAGNLIDVVGGGFWALIVFVGVGYAGSTSCMLAVRVIQVGWNARAIF